MNTTILSDNLQERDLSAALAKKGMDFTVSKRPLYDATGRELPGAFGIFNDRNEQFYGAVGNKYQEVQITTAGQPVQDIVDADPTAQFDNVGMLDGGRKFYVQANIETFDTVPGDSTKMLFTALGSHDGSSALQLLLTFIRIICRNTFAMAKAQGKENGTAFTVRHTVTAESRITDAGIRLAAAHAAGQDFKKTMQELSTVQINRSTMFDIMDRLFPIKTAEELAQAARKDNGMDKRRQTFLELFEYNDGDAFPIIRGSAYNVFNAVTELTDHYEKVVKTAGRTGQTEHEIRQEKAIFGTGAAFKTRALDVILDATKFAPRRSLPVSFAMNGNAPTFNDNASLLSAIIQ